MFDERPWVVNQIYISDVLDNSGKSEGKTPIHNSVSPGTPVYERGLSLEPQGIADTHQARCQKEGHGHTATGSSRTLELGIKRGLDQERALTVFAP